MSHEYHLLPRIARWIRRFRKRQGYGVHSPLAFQFITDVVYNAEPYYAYQQLRQPLAASASRLDEYDPVSGLTAKDLRLLFRLANYQEAATILTLGASPVTEAYLHAARTSAAIVHQLPAAPARPLLVYCERPQLLADLIAEAGTTPPALEGTLIVLRAIHRDAASRTLWHQLGQHPSVTLTFDLGRFGIALNRPKINRQDYVVNYF